MAAGVPLSLLVPEPGVETGGLMGLLMALISSGGGPDAEEALLSLVAWCP